MLNLNDFVRFMFGYWFYCLGILFVFGLLWVAFSMIKIRKSADIEVQFERQRDSFGNVMPERKYIIYKNTRYYLDTDLKLYNRFNNYYVIIGNKRIYVNY